MRFSCAHDGRCGPLDILTSRLDRDHNAEEQDRRQPQPNSPAPAFASLRRSRPSQRPLQPPARLAANRSIT
jgi:hypothetical protein